MAFFTMPRKFVKFQRERSLNKARMAIAKCEKKSARTHALEEFYCIKNNLLANLNSIKNYFRLFYCFCLFF